MTTQIKSFTSDAEYTVTLTNEGHACSCNDFRYRGHRRPCKHIFAEIKRIAAERAAQMTDEQLEAILLSDRKSAVAKNAAADELAARFIVEFAAPAQRGEVVLLPIGGSAALSFEIEIAQMMVETAALAA